LYLNVFFIISSVQGAFGLCRPRGLYPSLHRRWQLVSTRFKNTFWSRRHQWF